MNNNSPYNSEIINSPLLTTDEAGKYLNVSRSTVFDLIRHGELARVKIGRCTRVTLRDLDDFIAVKRKEQIALRASQGRGLV